jgi:hypothetical protein
MVRLSRMWRAMRRRLVSQIRNLRACGGSRKAALSDRPARRAESTVAREPNGLTGAAAPARGCRASTSAARSPAQRPNQRRHPRRRAGERCQGQRMRGQPGAGRMARTRQPSIPDRRESASAVTDNAAPWSSAAKPVGDASPRSFVLPKAAPADTSRKQKNGPGACSTRASNHP